MTRTYNNWDGSIPYVPVPANLVSTTGGGRQQPPCSTSTTSSRLTTDEYTFGAEFGSRSYVARFNCVRKIDTNGSKTLDLAMPYEPVTEMRSAVDPGPRQHHRDRPTTG